MKTSVALGERKIIELIQSQLELMPNMPVPFGDDVSACDLGNGNLVILKTDMLVDKTDVPPQMSLWQAARKAVVMNASDFAAKGVKPLAILVSLGLPASMTKKEIVDIGAGLNAGAKEYGAFILGGDTNEASDVVVSLSVFGTARREELMLRSGANVGDVVAVTGLFGKTSAGLKILINGLKAPKGIRGALVDSILTPHARLDEGLALSHSGAVTASIDSSDGLAWSLHELAKASNVGFLINNLPISKETAKFAEINKLDSVGLTLYGGEEYELVLAIEPRSWDRAKKAVRDAGGKLRQIGKTIPEKKLVLEVKGRRTPIEPRGWEHFSKR